MLLQPRCNLRTVITSLPQSPSKPTDSEIFFPHLRKWRTSDCFSQTMNEKTYFTLPLQTRRREGRSGSLAGPRPFPGLPGLGSPRPPPPGSGALWCPPAPGVSPRGSRSGSSAEPGGCLSLPFRWTTTREASAEPVAAAREPPPARNGGARSPPASAPRAGHGRAAPGCAHRVCKQRARRILDT